ncbi:hypothetical protein Q5752_003450 [Cryptotrichosporon argae]
MLRVGNAAYDGLGGSGRGAGASASASGAPPPPGPSRPAVGSGGKDWKYEMRREAQLIVPGLYLGPYQASTNLHRLHELGVTHILCVRDSKEARLIFPRFPTEFRYMTLDISDSVDQNLITIFPSCKQFIDEALQYGGTVLVHCNGGISLAPAIVIGYLMEQYNWDYAQATQFVQSKRYCVSPMSFETQFKEYGPIQAARKAITHNGTLGVGKRSMSEESDDEDHAPRSAPAPPRDIDGDTDMA